MLRIETIFGMGGYIFPAVSPRHRDLCDARKLFDDDHAGLDAPGHLKSTPPLATMRQLRHSLAGAGFAPHEEADASEHVAPHPAVHAAPDHCAATPRPRLRHAVPRALASRAPCRAVTRRSG